MDFYKLKYIIFQNFLSEDYFISFDFILVSCFWYLEKQLQIKVFLLLLFFKFINIETKCFMNVKFFFSRIR